MKTIRHRIDAIAKAAQGATELKQLRSELNDSRQRADQLSQHSFALFGILAGVWILLKLSTSQKISALGLEITDIPLLLAVIPALAAFAFYRFAAAEGLVALLEVAFREIDKRELPISSRENMTELLTITSVQHLESSLSNLEAPDSFFSKIAGPWMLVLAAALILAPLGVLGWMFVSGLYLNTVPLVVRVISLASTAMLASRGLTVFAQCMRGIG